MKILQIVESLNNGAVENWLVRSFLEVKKQRPNWQWTFFCIINQTGKLDDKVRDNGGEIIYSSHSISEKLVFLRNLKKITKDNKFDIIHAHHDYLNAFYLMSFYRNRAFKISHIHNTDKHLPIKRRLLNKVIIPILKLVNNLGYDLLLGISTDTIREFKFSISKNQSKNILYYGIELKKIESSRFRKDILDTLNWSSESIILLFIGRFTDLKNPGFLVEILHELNLKSSLPFHALFVGEGEEEKKIESLSKKYSLEEKIHISGWVDEPEKYFQMADVFVFPRIPKPTEGFGMVMLEAQAAGIQIIVSKGVLNETIVIHEIVHVLDNVTNPIDWADVILKNYNKGHLNNSIELMKDSSFHIRKSSESLIKIYEKTA